MRKYIACGSGYQVIRPEVLFNVRQASNQNIDPDFLYVAVRAVSAGELHGPNNNGDYFGLNEIRRAYSSFLNRGVFVNHQSNDVEKCRGRVVESNLVDLKDQCWVKLLLGVDQTAFPQLARSIRKRYVNDVSMGATVRYSFCSIKDCRNEAHNEKQYCDHLKNYKGSRFAGQRVFEDNRDVNFFEISFVVDGADPDAKILELYDNLSPVTQRVGGQTQNHGKLVRVASVGTEIAIGEVVEYVQKLRASNRSLDMIKRATQDKFPQLTEREVDLAVLSTPNSYKTACSFTGRAIPTSILNGILNG